MNGPNEKGHQHPIVRGDLTSIQNVLPSVDPPLPIRLRIENHHRATARTTGPMITPIGLRSIAVVLGHTGRIIANPIGFAQQWKLPKFRKRAELDPIALVMLAIESVLGEYFRKQTVQAN